jgi:hypothetical protein
MLGQALKYFALCLLITAVGCSSRIEYVYYSAEKEAPAVNAMVTEYCLSGNDVAKRLVSDFWTDKQIRVVYCGSIKTAVDMKLMIFDPAAPGTWPGINFPLIALVKNGKIIDAYYESSSDFLDKSVFDYDNDQVRLYLLRRSGGMRVMNFAISDNMISVVKTEMINSR